MKTIFVLSHSYGWRQTATTCGTFSTKEKAKEFRDDIIKNVQSTHENQFAIFEEPLDPTNPAGVVL